MKSVHQSRPFHSSKTERLQLKLTPVENLNAVWASPYVTLAKTHMTVSSNGKQPKVLVGTLHPPNKAPARGYLKDHFPRAMLVAERAFKEHSMGASNFRAPIPILRSPHLCAKSSSREVRIRVSTFSVVYFSRGTLPPKRGKRALLGDLV